MVRPQAELAETLATEFGMEVLKFRHFDALILKRSEILKLFVPRSMRAYGGKAGERRIDGDLLFVHSEKLVPLRRPSTKFDEPDDSFGCPLFNFPWLVGFPTGDPRRADQYFPDALRAAFESLPDDVPGWKDHFGNDFFEQSWMDKLSLIVGFIREQRPEATPRQIPV